MKSKSLLTPLFLASFLFFVSQGWSQQWVDLREENAPFEEIIEEFQNTYPSGEYVKGRGIKQFERWRCFWEPRLSSENGPDAVSPDEWLGHSRLRAQSGGRDNGTWESLGLAEWTSISSAPGNGRINCIAFNPNDNSEIYIGTPSGGLWKSEDSGDSWIPLTDELPTLGISAIVIDHSNDQRVFIGTGDRDNLVTYGIGVLVSEDGGQSWNTTGLSWDLSYFDRVHKLIMDPSDSEIIFAATSDGLYRTTNGGFTWSEKLSGNIRDVEFNPFDSQKVYASRDRLYMSEDGGGSFSEVEDPNLPAPNQVDRMGIAVCESSSETVYLLIADETNSAFEGLYISEDGGSNWSLQSDSPNILGASDDGSGAYGQAWYDMEIIVDPADEDHLFVGGINLWESENGGQSWTLNAYFTYPGVGGINYVHADIHNLSYSGGNLFVGSDGGIYRSTNNGNTFSDLSSGLEISQFYRLGSYAGDSDLILAGTQDNGTNLYENGDWSHVYFNDGMEAAIHPTNPDIMFCSYQYGAILKSTNGGNTFEWAAQGISEDGPWVTPYIISEADPNTMYAGFTNVWKTETGGGPWTQISDFPSGLITCLAIGVSEPETIYAGSTLSLFRSTDDGGDWESISFGLPDGLTGIAVDPSDAMRIWACFSGFDEGQKVFYSSNGGENWTNISHNLPNVPINCIVHNGDTEEGTYIGTEIGVFYTDETLAHWESFNENLPNVIISELEINYTDEVLLAATYGRGIWRSDLWEAPTEVPVVNAISDREYLCVGQSIEFTDLSINNGPAWSWTFEGGNPSSSTEMNPEVSYDASGTYDYILTVENENGSSTYECDDCIEVYDIPSEPAPLIEGFEDISSIEESGWHLTTDEFGNSWQHNSDVSYSGDQCAWINNHALDVETEYDLISPAVDLSQINPDDGGILTFKCAFVKTDSENEDRLRLYISTDCGENFSLKNQWTADQLKSSSDSEDAFVPSGSDDWNEFTYQIDDSDLTENTMFLIRFENGNGNNIYLDDINIISGGTNIGSFEPDLQLKAYPIPTDDLLNLEINQIRSDLLSVAVVDNLGNVLISAVLKTKHGRNDLALNISSLSSGNYILKIQGRSGVKTMNFQKL